MGWHQYLNQPRSVDGTRDRQQATYLGPAFSDDFIERFLTQHQLPHTKLDRKAIPARIAELIDGQNVIGWFQGRMEYGPRALGARSIIGDPRSKEMQSTMNLKIKYRESFRPFAPSVMVDQADQYFDIDRPSPYMLLVAPVREARRIAMTNSQNELFGIDKLNVPRSDLPAITHIDYSARIQSVAPEDNPLYYEMIDAFRERTGMGLVINTSFNVRGEPIVCSPFDAFKCFMRTEMDYLLLGSFLLSKSEQPRQHDQIDWDEKFELD